MRKIAPIPVEKLPWMVAMPVKPSSFQPLHLKYRNLNVEADFGAFSAYQRSDRSEGIRCIYSDLQTKPTANGVGRLGSGRAGFYKSYYLKGIGRTPLAANWRYKWDLAHSTGHLGAASAFRELLVSEFAKLKGASDILNPCDSVLIRRYDPHMKTLWRELADLSIEKPPAAVRHLQAISVKKGEFARISNFIWLFNQHWTPKRISFMDVLRLMWQMLPQAGEQEGVCLPVMVSPRGLCERLDHALTTSIARFKVAFELGVTWASMPNNTTFDGRILDLETSEIFGHPFFGVSNGKFKKQQFRAFVGVDVLGYLAEFRQFIEFLRYRLKYLVDSEYLLYREEKILAAAFLENLAKTFPDHNLLFSKKKTELLLISWMDDHLIMSRKNKPQLRELVRLAVEHSFRFSTERNELPDLPMKWTPVFGKTARNSKGTQLGVLRPEFIEFPRVSIERWRALQQYQCELYEIAEVDRFLEKLKILPKQLHQIYAT